MFNYYGTSTSKISLLLLTSPLLHSLVFSARSHVPHIEELHLVRPPNITYLSKSTQKQHKLILFQTLSQTPVICDSRTSLVKGNLCISLVLRPFFFMDLSCWTQESCTHSTLQLGTRQCEYAQCEEHSPPQSLLPPHFILRPFIFFNQERQWIVANSLSQHLGFHRLPPNPLPSPICCSTTGSPGYPTSACWKLFPCLWVSLSFINASLQSFQYSTWMEGARIVYGIHYAGTRIFTIKYRFFIFFSI